MDANQHEHEYDVEGSDGEYWYECQCGATKPFPPIPDDPYL